MKLYVGNLSFETNETSLQDAFAEFGTVTDSVIMIDRTTNRSRGFGFVTMMTVDEAIRAVDTLHDKEFMGRKLVVSGAKTKDHEDEGKEDAAESEEPAA